MPPMDPAIIRALSLDAQAKISTHGGSGFTSTYRITTPSTSIFVKTSTSSGAASMFEGEHASLNAIHNAVPTLAPKAFVWGQLDSTGYFLATEFLDMSTRGSSSVSLASKLATLHTTPIPSEHRGKGFGFPVPTCCGETLQDNSFKPSWSQFFAENRLMHILKCAEKNQGPDRQLRKTIETICDTVVPRLLGELQIEPRVCHGDLWSGNKGRASFSGRGDVVEEVVFDPSVCYGHNEYDHGIMNMFGGFSSSFWKEYHALCPKTEPADGYEDRVKLYEAYHHLNHYAIFGGGYKSAAMGLLNGLLKKYG